MADQKLRLEYVRAGDLAENPANWRQHPEAQKAALSALLADPDIGWAGAMLFNERTGRMIDGHARKSVSDPNALVPVLIGSWSEAAERKILATLDPLAAMATVDAARLSALLANIDLAGDVLAELKAKLDRDITAATPKALDASPQLAGYTFKVLVECRDETHQAELLQRLDAEGLKASPLIV